MLQLLVTLRFYASGNMLISAGDFGGIHKCTASRIVRSVSGAIAALAPDFIRFPHTHNELETLKLNFYNIAKFPRVIGAIDCTHVRIQSPGGNQAETFRNRKGYFSLNVQVVSDDNLKIQNVVARWPGSCHDSTIFANSRLKAQFENGDYGDAFLLGDSGYGIAKYLMTPLTDPTTRQESLYNESHIRTRNCVERLFGVWKRRFPILSKGTAVTLRTVQRIIVACAVLHNICRDMKDTEPDDNHTVLPQQEYVEGREINEENRDGDQIRSRLVEEYFANLT